MTIAESVQNIISLIDSKDDTNILVGVYSANAVAYQMDEDLDNLMCVDILEVNRLTIAIVNVINRVMTGTIKMSRDDLKMCFEVKSRLFKISKYIKILQWEVKKSKARI